MGKRETKESYKDTKTERGATTAEYDAAQAEAAKRAGGLEGISTTGRNNLIEGYSGLGTAGTLAPQSISTRPIDVGELKTTLPRLREFADTGGFTPERTSSIMENVGGLKEFGRTGGLSSENINRMRGMGGFDEFAATGGIDPTQRANIRAKAISPIGSYATGTRDELSRRLALQGGYGPGFDSANRALQRDTSRAIADTSLNAELGIQDRVNEGRRFGISGIAGTEAGLAGLQSGNKLAGMQAAGNMELNLQDSISRYRAAGLSMEQATARALAEFDSMNVGNEMQAGMFNAGNQMQADQFNINNAQNVRMAGLGGLQNIYGSDVGQYQSELDRRNQLLGGGTQANLGYLGQQGQLGMQPGVGSNIMKGIGTAAGIAGMVYTGGLSGAIGGAVGGGGGNTTPTTMPTNPAGAYPGMGGVGGTQYYRPYPYLRGA